jgi:hypothetical protein
MHCVPHCTLHIIHIENVFHGLSEGGKKGLCSLTKSKPHSVLLLILLVTFHVLLSRRIKFQLRYLYLAIMPSCIVRVAVLTL